MAFALYDTDVGTGNDPAAFAAIVQGNEQAIAAHHLSASAPVTGLANGWMWLDSTSSTLYVLNIRQNGAWVTVFSCTATALTLVKDLDFNGNEAVGLLLESLATGSLSTTESRLQWDDTLNLVAWGDGTDTLYCKGFKSDASSYIRIPCSLNTVTHTAGALPPDHTTHITGGYQLDTAARRLNVVALRPIPSGWTTANDLILEVECLLLNAETASDTINIGCTWRSLSTGDLPTKTGTAATDASQSIGASTTQYARHLVSVTIDHDDVTNPVAVDDYFIATIDHDIAAGANPVAGVAVIGAYLKVPSFGPEDE